MVGADHLAQDGFLTMAVKHRQPTLPLELAYPQGECRTLVQQAQQSQIDAVNLPPQRRQVLALTGGSVPLPGTHVVSGGRPVEQEPGTHQPSVP